MKRKYLLIPLLLMLFSCQKEYLEKKPVKALLVPETLQDFQALLDNTRLMNNTFLISWIATDEMTATDAGYEAYVDLQVRNTYIWAKDVYEGLSIPDWDTPYSQIFTSNIVLEGLAKIENTSTDQNTFNNVKGAALFFRAFALYNLSQEFAEPYLETDAASKLGIPIRLTSDINYKSKRGTLKETYEQIVKDLTDAVPLLSTAIVYNTRPSKPAVLALLARVNLSMQSYSKALGYADQALALESRILDYNTETPWIANGNAEVLFNCGSYVYSFLTSSLTGCSKELYDSYREDDLRKNYFWADWGTGSLIYQGSFSQNMGVFMGLATDELLLIKAECLVRTGDYTGGIDALNYLLARRYKKDSFVPVTANNEDDALLHVLTERKKELVGRGTRWSDLRRLNMDPRFKTTITRTVKGKVCQLVPGDKRYVFPIPDNEIRGSGIEQNER